MRGGDALISDCLSRIDVFLSRVAIKLNYRREANRSKDRFPCYAVLLAKECTISNDKSSLPRLQDGTQNLKIKST